MCWEFERHFFAEEKKAKEARVKQEQRASVIDKLLNEANAQSENTNSKERRSKSWRLQNSRLRTTL